MKIFIIALVALNVILMTQAMNKETIIQMRNNENIITDNLPEIDNNKGETKVNLEEVQVEISKDKDSAVEMQQVYNEVEEPVQRQSSNYEFQKYIDQKIKEEEFGRKYNSFGDEEGRTFPLFVSYEFQEPQSQRNKILYELTEKQAIYLHMMSGVFEDLLEASTNGEEEHKHEHYCKEKYDSEIPTIAEKRITACKHVRSVKYAVLNKIHRTTMKFIIDYVEHYEGIEPCPIREEKMEPVLADANPTNANNNGANANNAAGANANNAGANAPNAGANANNTAEVKKVSFTRWVKGVDETNWTLTFGSAPDEIDQKYPVDFVNNLWNNQYNIKQDHTDISFVLLAASALKIETLAALCGAKTALETQRSMKDGTFATLASIMLDDPWFLKAEL